VQKIVAECPISAEILDAVDAQRMSNAQRASLYLPQMYTPHYPFVLRDSEIACFQSHRKAWQRIINQGLDGALIVEDDVELDADLFSSAFYMAQKYLEPASYIRFPIKNRETPQKILDSSNNQRLFIPRNIGLGMQAQLVGARAAKVLLAATEQFDRPVDVLIQMSWLTGIYPSCVIPAGVHEVSKNLGGSTIGKKMQISEKLKREILRFIYRKKIARLQIEHLNYLYPYLK